MCVLQIVLHFSCQILLRLVARIIFSTRCILVMIVMRALRVTGSVAAGILLHQFNEYLNCAAEGSLVF